VVPRGPSTSDGDWRSPNGPSLANILGANPENTGSGNIAGYIAAESHQPGFGADDVWGDYGKPIVVIAGSAATGALIGGGIGLVASGGNPAGAVAGAAYGFTVGAVAGAAYLFAKDCIDNADLPKSTPVPTTPAPTSSNDEEQTDQEQTDQEQTDQQQTDQQQSEQAQNDQQSNDSQPRPDNSTPDPERSDNGSPRSDSGFPNPDGAGPVGPSSFTGRLNLGDIVGAAFSSRSAMISTIVDVTQSVGRAVSAELSAAASRAAAGE
jgi:hypothetical protein